MPTSRRRSVSRPRRRRRAPAAARPRRYYGLQESPEEKEYRRQQRVKQALRDFDAAAASPRPMTRAEWSGIAPRPPPARSLTPSLARTTPSLARTPSEGIGTVVVRSRYGPPPLQRSSGRRFSPEEIPAPPPKRGLLDRWLDSRREARERREAENSRRGRVRVNYGKPSPYYTPPNNNYGAWWY